MDEKIDSQYRHILQSDAADQLLMLNEKLAFSPFIKKIASHAMDPEESWRVLAIMAEFVEATERLQGYCPAVSIFGSARTPQDHPEYLLAEKIARVLSDAGFSVISGGGPGIMEAANKGAYAGSSASIGLNIQLPNEQHSNQYQDVSQTFRHFFARKYMFVRLASAYVVMPGGFGTLDELAETLTLIQTERAPKMPIFLVGKTYWKGLVAWFKDQLLSNRMISEEDMNLFQIMDDPQEIVEAIFSHYQGHVVSPFLEEYHLFFNI